MLKLLRYLKEYKKECIVGPLFKLLEAIFELLVPLVMMKIINEGIVKGDTGYVIGMGVVLVVIGAVGLAWALTAQYFAANAAIGMSTSIRRDLFMHINRLSYNELDHLGTSTLISRLIGDVNQVQTAVNLVLRLVLRSPFVVFGAMIMAFTIDTELAVMFVLVIPILAVIVMGVMIKTLPMMRQIQGQFDKILRRTRENLTGIRVVRAFNRQEEDIKTYEEESDALLGFQRKAAWISSLMNPATYAVVNLAIVLLLFWGSSKINRGALDQAAIITLMNYMTQILVELIKLASLIVTLTKAIASGDRIQEIFEVEPSIVSNNQFPVTPAADAPKIEFRKVSMTYVDAKEPALSDIGFEVQKGETVGIIGGTGSGKTTLVHLIPRLYDTSSGMIMLDGRDIEGYPTRQLRTKIGIVPQKAVLFKGTIRENICWGKPGASDNEIIEALKTAQAWDFVEEKPEKLDFCIEQGGKNLSGGQRQRLTIARALVKRPDILILDDSASALDYVTDAKLRRAIREFTQNATVLIVSQRASAIMHADKILVMDDGELVGVGTHQELLQSCETYQEICASQLTDQEVKAV